MAWLEGGGSRLGWGGDGGRARDGRVLRVGVREDVLGIQKGKDPLADKQDAVKSPHFKHCNNTQRDPRVWFQPHKDLGSRAGQGSSLPTSDMERLKPEV